jgi:hypothetical protein
MSSLWPSVSAAPPRTMAEMLYDAAGDLARITNNKLDFYVDAVGVAEPPAGPVTKIRYNCYIRVIKAGNVHLFFQVTTPSASPFDADIGTPEGERFTSIKDENELLNTIKQIMQRPRTTEVINYLLRLT